MKPEPSFARISLRRAGVKHVYRGGIAMKISTVLLAAAMGGALVGAVGCGDKMAPGATDPSAAAGSMPSTSETPAMPAAKHACKGQNGCKGQGGCKTDKNGCKGQNACKGQGGCKTA
jgi:hypothetical protein